MEFDPQYRQTNVRRVATNNNLDYSLRMTLLCLNLYSLQRSLSTIDTIGTTKNALYMEVYLIQRLSNAVKCYCGTRTSVLKREMSFI